MSSLKDEGEKEGENPFNMSSNSTIVVALDGTGTKRQKGVERSGKKDKSKPRQVLLC